MEYSDKKNREREKKSNLTVYVANSGQKNQVKSTMVSKEAYKLPML